MFKKNCLSSKTIRTITRPLVIALLLPFGVIHSLQAQTEFEIKSDDQNLEQEYRDELDKWMLRAYEGDRDAQFKVGVLFTNDQFDRPDYEQAVYWYKQAARQGHVLAQYNLGHQYLTGVGVSKNDLTAMQWWIKAAEQDHALAQFNVGRAYYLGIGLEEDHIQSKYWFERAAYNQEPKSIDILKQLGWYSDAIDTQPSAPIGSDNSDIVRQVEQAAPTEPTLTSKIIPLEQDTPEDSQADPQVEQQRAVATDVARVEQRPQVVSEESTTADTAAVGQATEASRGGIEQTLTTAEPVPAAPIKNPIALYTNPAVRSVLIAIIDDRDSLEVLTKSGDWSIVKSSSGFPVWIHSDFLKVTNKIATVTGQAVNARSVPIVTNGTVVGRLDQGERLSVLNKRKEWYRVIAPSSFKAWVKTEDFNKTSVAVKPTKPNGWVARSVLTPSKPKPKPANTAATTSSTKSTASTSDNEWLFAQSPENFTLQLASFDDLAKVQEFVSRQKFVGNPNLHRFTAMGNNIEWTYFLYGSYANRERAEQVKVEISQKRAWIRTFGRLQQNRCVAWKKQLPTPRELNQYCIQ